MELFVPLNLRIWKNVRLESLTWKILSPRIYENNEIKDSERKRKKKKYKFYKYPKMMQTKKQVKINFQSH